MEESAARTTDDNHRAMRSNPPSRPGSNDALNSQPSALVLSVTAKIRAPVDDARAKRIEMAEAMNSSAFNENFPTKSGGSLKR